MPFRYLFLILIICGFSSVRADTDPFGPKFAASYEEIVQTFTTLVQENPDAIRKNLLIRTPEDRELAIYTLGNTATKRRTLLLCNHHGDEQWVAQLCVDFVKYMLSAKVNDPLIKDVLQHSAIDVLPLGNPDGFAKKNRYNSRDVDINRNFPFMWGYIEPGSVNTKPGPFAVSEPETKALHDYQLAHEGEWVVVLNYHLRYPNSDAQNYILTPWAYTRKKKLTVEEMAQYRIFLPSTQEAPTFKVDTVPNVFYPCSGVHTDWTHHTFSAPSMTMELGHGYELPSREVYLKQYLKAENLPVFRRFLTGVQQVVRH